MYQCFCINGNVLRKFSGAVNGTADAGSGTDRGEFCDIPGINTAHSKNGGFDNSLLNSKAPEAVRFLSSEGVPDLFKINDLILCCCPVKSQSVDGTLQAFIAAALGGDPFTHGFKKLLHDKSIAAAVAVAIGEFQSCFGNIADIFPAQGLLVDVQGHGSFSTLETHPALRDGTEHGVIEGHLNTVPKPGNRNKTVVKIGVVVERSFQAVRIPETPEGILSVFLAVRPNSNELLIFRRQTGMTMVQAAYMM